MRNRRWSDQDIISAVKKSRSIRQVIHALGLIPAGGNYVHVQRRVNELKIDTTHFLGKGWSKGLPFARKPPIPLEKILVQNSNYQSFKLKKRLFVAEIKKKECEECGWKKISEDGRIPLELDHINGNRADNRVSNLRVLCPNCHSLKPTHRGKNKKRG
jgi:5-methylcytosine-specific restriction endonuclease McrA